MNVGELFVKIGITGAEGSKKALSGIGDGMKSLFSSSMATKLAIGSMVYGLKEMMGFGMNAGQSLQDFSNLTGLSAQELQKWQYAARQFGVANESVEGSLKALQQALGDQQMGTGQIAGFSRVAETVGIDIDKAYDDSFYMMGKLQQFAQKFKGSASEKNSILRSFGVDEGMIIALNKAAFTKERMGKADILGKGETDELAKFNVAFANIENKFKMAIAKIVANDFAPLVQMLTDAANAVLKIGDAIYKVTKALKVFEGLSHFADMISTISSAAFGEGKEKEEAQGSVKGFFETLASMTPLGQSLMNKPSETIAKRNYGAGNSQSNNFVINQNFQNNGENAKEVKDASIKGIQDAWWQLPSGVTNGN